MQEKFIQYLRTERRYSEHTLLAYNSDLEKFTQFLEIASDSDFNRILARDVREWVMDLNQAGLSNRSINRKLSSIRAFYKWMKKENKIEINPLAKIKGPKMEKRLPHFAKQTEMESLTFKIDSNEFEDIRDNTILEVFYQTGIRLSELIGLTDNQVQVNYIRVIGKRNKERQIPISTGLYQLINKYQSKRNEEGIAGEKLFVLKNGKNLYPKLVYRRINLYLSEVTSLDKKSPHVLRHTFATHMLNNGAGLETLKELLGHANLAATQVYTHNSFKQLSSIYSQAHPRGRNTN
jgi:integrase/recombinase XerC